MKSDFGICTQHSHIYKNAGLDIFYSVLQNILQSNDSEKIQIVPYSRVLARFMPIWASSLYPLGLIRNNTYENGAF